MGTVRKLDERPGAVPVFYSTGLEEPASYAGALLEAGFVQMTELFGIEPRLQAMLLSENDWKDAPCEAGRPYPFGLPYFTRSAEIPTLVLPSKLSEVFQPLNIMTFPLAVWHELAHAFFLSTEREVVKTPHWMTEFVPQAAAAAVALREDFPLTEHLSRLEEPDFTVRGFALPASAVNQMRFQNLLLLFSADVIQQFGDEFLSPLVRSLWGETDVVSEHRAEELFITSLGRGGREWLSGKNSF